MANRYNDAVENAMNDNLRRHKLSFAFPAAVFVSFVVLEMLDYAGIGQKLASLDPNFQRPVQLALAPFEHGVRCPTATRAHVQVGRHLDEQHAKATRNARSIC
jgi:hypothetical protein